MHMSVDAAGQNVSVGGIDLGLGHHLPAELADDTIGHPDVELGFGPAGDHRATSDDEVEMACAVGRCLRRFAL